jgi:hypothetical protein
MTSGIPNLFISTTAILGTIYSSSDNNKMKTTLVYKTPSGEEVSKKTTNIYW